jgi:hypothetical protein
MTWKNPSQPTASYFEEANIRLIFSELKTRFGFPEKEWKNRFADYCKQHQVTDPMEGFHKFGNDVINPVLNEILCRKSGYPKFQKMVEYVTRKGWR